MQEKQTNGNKSPASPLSPGATAIQVPRTTCRPLPSLRPLPSPPPTLLLLAVFPAPTLFSLCSKLCTKALTDPWAVTQTVKNVYTLVVFHCCA